MELFSDKIKELLITKVDSNSKQKDHQITFKVYNLLFQDSVKDLWNKYRLDQFELAQSGQIPFAWVFSHKMRENPRWQYSINYIIDNNDNFIDQYNRRFIDLNYYTYSQGYGNRRDRISDIRKYLFLKKDSSNYQEQLKLYKEEKERIKEKYEKEHKEWIEEKKEEKIKKQQYQKKRKEKQENSKKISKDLTYNLQYVLSVDNTQILISSPRALINIGVVYGIVINNKIVYIGSTEALSQRIKQHEDCVKNHTNAFQQKYLYKDMREHGYRFIVLFRGEKVVNKEQLESIQFGYITKYHPKYNYLGVKGKFKWQDKKEEKDKITWDEWIKYKEID